MTRKAPAQGVVEVSRAEDPFVRHYDLPMRITAARLSTLAPPSGQALLDAGPTGRLYVALTRMHGVRHVAIEDRRIVVRYTPVAKIAELETISVIPSIMLHLQPLF